MTRPTSNQPPQQVRQPSLMDHLIALRQEVHALRTEVDVLKGASAVNADLISSQTKATNTNTSIVEQLVEGVSQIYQMLKQQPAQPVPPTAQKVNQSSRPGTEYQTFGDRFKDEDADF